MQLTTARLKQIIKEELESIVNEEEGLLNEDLGSSVAVITAITYGIGALVATGAAVGTIDTLKSLVQSLRNKKGPLKEDMNVAQALLAAVSALTAIGASAGIIDTLKALAEQYRNNKQMEEAKKRAAKASAAGKAKVKNPYAGAASHKMSPMKKGK